MTLPVTRFLHNCSPAYAEAVASSPYVYLCLVSAAVLGGTALLLAASLLLASKLAISGQRPCLVFLRSKCVAEMVVGVYSLLKMHYLLYVDIPERVNAFLADSLLFAALFLINMTLTLETLNCLCQLQQPARPRMLLGKGSAVTVTILLWNAAFVFGFLPQMGWNANESTCLYGEYYSSSYVAMATTVLLGCVVLSGSLQMALLRWLQHLEQRLSSRQQVRLGLQNLDTSLHTLRLQTSLQGVFTAPYLAYLCLQTAGLPSDQGSASLHLVYATPATLLRTLLSLVLYTLHTPPITTLMMQALYRLRIQSVHFYPRRHSSIVPSNVVDISHVRSPSVLTVEGYQLPVFPSGPASHMKYSPEVSTVPEVYIIDADHQQSALEQHGNLATSATSLHQLHDQLPPANIPLEEIASILAQLEDDGASAAPRPFISSHDTHRRSLCSHLAHSEPSQRPSICSHLTCSEPSQRPSICSHLTCSEPSQRPSICSYLTSPGPSQRPSICSLIITPDGSHRASITSHVISPPSRGRASFSSQIYIPAHSQHPASEPVSRHHSPRGSSTSQDLIQYHLHRPSVSQEIPSVSQVIPSVSQDFSSPTVQNDTPRQPPCVELQPTEALPQPPSLSWECSPPAITSERPTWPDPSCSHESLLQTSTIYQMSAQCPIISQSPGAELPSLPTPASPLQPQQTPHPTQLPAPCLPLPHTDYSPLQTVHSHQSSIFPAATTLTVVAEVTGPPLDDLDDLVHNDDLVTSPVTVTSSSSSCPP